MSTSISDIFEKYEIVSANDLDADPNSLVYMDSDSESSEKMNGDPMQEIALQETISTESEINHTQNNPIHFEIKASIKREEEVIVDDVIPIDNTEEFESLPLIFGNDVTLESTGPPRSPDSSPISTVNDNEIEFTGPSTSFGYDQYNIITIEPPPNMPPPPEYSEMDEEQFEIINDANESNKTDEDGSAMDTSLVDQDHPYSQPETRNQEFCDDLVRNMLNETGNESNPSAVRLLSKFTEIFEHIVVEDPESQTTLYLRSMKKTLVGLNVETEEKASSTPEPAKSPKPKFEPVPATQSESENENDDVPPDSIEIPETQSSNEEEATVVDAQKEAADDVKKESVIKVENENATKVKSAIKSVQDFGQKLSDDARDLLNLQNETDEDAVGVKLKLMSLLKSSRKEYRKMMKEIRGECSSDLNEQSKKQLIKNLSESSDYPTSDSEDLDQSVILNRKVPKPPAIVSSTKEDSEVSDEEEPKLETRSQSSSSDESETSNKVKSIEKQIEKLIDLSSLNCPKPASSKKVTKIKKLKKKKKKRTSDIDSLLGSTSDDDDDDNTTTNPPSSSSDDSPTPSDEENQMLLKHNAAIKQSLLAMTESEEESYSGDEMSESESSDDDEKEKKSIKKVKAEEAPVEKSAEANELSDKEEDKIEEAVEEAIVQVAQQVPVDYSKSPTKLTTTANTAEDGETSDEQRKAKRPKIHRDSFEREIFRKDFLEINGASTSSSSKSKTSSTPSGLRERKFKVEGAENGKKSPEVIGETIDVSMFENARVTKEIDLTKMFEKRANAGDVAGPSTTNHANQAKPAPVINEDEWISLSSDSDSEISAQPSGSNPRIPNRKKMLTEEELQEETKKAQKEETQRVDRLKKKNEVLTQMLSQRLSQEADSQNELILDYDPKRNITIKVHPLLVTKLKDHQKEGIKFMYDTCYGSIADKVKTESGCILAHCMGLGKTLQLIAMLHTLIRYPEHLKTSHVLVICPKSTIMNWYEEFKKWLDKIEVKGLKIYFLEDQKKFHERVNTLMEWRDSKRPGVFLINYEAFRYMVHYTGSKKATIKLPDQEVKRLQENIGRCLLSPGPDLVVCDEGHLIKNQSGATNKAICKIETRRRIILTGTPVQNNLNEYYAMVDWIKPALLGTMREFNNLYGNPIKDGQHMDSTPQMIKRMKQRSFILYRKLSKFVQRKEATVLKQFLPEKYEYCIFVPLTPVQEQLYEHYLMMNPVQNGHQLLNDYTALRKIWTHPKVLKNARDRAIKGEIKIGELKKRSKNQVDEGDEEPDDLLDRVDGNTGVKSNWWEQFVVDEHLESLETSNKLMLLFEILRISQMKEEKVLVFSAFVAVLNVVEMFMKKIHNRASDPNAEAYGYNQFAASWVEGYDYFRLDGSTKRDARHAMIQKFNDSSNKRLRCFLISAKAGGQGINLIGANRCIILDTAWNPSSDQQNIFRIYRLGQPKACFVYRLIALGTMEEKVYSRSVTKQAMSGRVVDKLQIDRHYRMDELSQLYTLTKFEPPSTRQMQNPPSDDVLKYLLHNHPLKAFKYHNHDSLLENRIEEDLNEDEINEAWQVYEAESRGPAARVAFNGNLPPHVNDLMRPDLLNMNYLAAASATSLDAGLFKQLYQQQPSNFFPSDYLQSLLPFDISGAFLNNSVVPTPPSSSALPQSLNAPGSSLLRTQLAANMSSPVFNPQMFNSFVNPSTSINNVISSNLQHKPPQNLSAMVPKRRPSNPRKSPSASNIQNLVQLQQRFNGNIGKNASANLAILPDNTSIARKPSPSQMKKVPSNSNINKNKPVPSATVTMAGISPQQRTQMITTSPQFAARTSITVNKNPLKTVQAKTVPRSPAAAPLILKSTKQSIMQPSKAINIPQMVSRPMPPKAGPSNVLQKQPNPKTVLQLHQEQQQRLKQLTIGNAPRINNVTMPSARRNILVPAPTRPADPSRVPKHLKQYQQLSNQKGNQISITKLASPGSNKLEMRKPQVPSALTVHKLQPNSSKINSQPSSSSSVQTSRVITVAPKRPSNAPIPQSPKRIRLGIPPNVNQMNDKNVIKVLSREERDKLRQNTPSIIEDIVEIE